jgi:hypothetical protein
MEIEPFHIQVKENKMEPFGDRLERCGLDCPSQDRGKWRTLVNAIMNLRVT